MAQEINDGRVLQLRSGASSKKLQQLSTAINVRSGNRFRPRSFQRTLRKPVFVCNAWEEE